jgi:hypothetical protein
MEAQLMSHVKVLDSHFMSALVKEFLKLEYGFVEEMNAPHRL